jgi:hypothetical protein
MGERERIEFLKTKHEALETELKDEKRKLQPDPAAVAAIKKRKLVVKDEITRLAHS